MVVEVVVAMVKCVTVEYLRKWPHQCRGVRRSAVVRREGNVVRQSG